MTDPKRKSDPAMREAKAKKPLGLSVRPVLRLPHEDLIKTELESQPVGKSNEINELSSPIGAPTSHPYSDPFSAPIDRPIRELNEEAFAAPTSKSIGQPASSLNSAPVSTPIAEPTYRAKSISRHPAVLRSHDKGWLDATHSSSEQRVYSIMYRVTLSKGTSDGYFSVKGLQKATGISSHNTVREALRGLIRKLSIEVVNRELERNIGPLYRVFTPDEIMTKRNRAGIVIHPATKKIVEPGSPIGSSISTPIGAPVAASVTHPTGEPHGLPERAPTIEGHAPQKLESMNNIKNNSDDSANASSSLATYDDEKVTQVKRLFEQLSGGGKWKDERDLKSYGEISHVPSWHVIMGLCYSVGKSPEHKMSSLAYAVPSILDHYQQMAIFPASEMLEIAYRTMRKTLLCLETGKWTVSEWES